MKNSLTTNTLTSKTTLTKKQMQKNRELADSVSIDPVESATNDEVLRQWTKDIGLAAAGRLPEHKPRHPQSEPLRGMRGGSLYSPSWTPPSEPKNPAPSQLDKDVRSRRRRGKEEMDTLCLDIVEFAKSHPEYTKSQVRSRFKVDYSVIDRLVREHDLKLSRRKGAY